MTPGACRFGREDRLRRRLEFLRIYEKGRRIHGPGFVLFYIRGETGRHRIGLTVPARVGVAVVRNRVKRRFRDIFRRHREVLGEEALDLVVNISTEGASATQKGLEEGFLRAAAAARRGKGRAPRGPRRAVPRSPMGNRA